MDLHQPAEVIELPAAVLSSASLPKIEADDTDVVATGREAWRRVKACRLWDDWVAVGKALMVGRNEAMRVANTNRPEGKGYNKEFSKWLDQNGFGDIHKSDRAKLLNIIDDLPKIEEWRAKLTEAERARLNHPHSVDHAVYRCAERRMDGGSRWGSPTAAATADEVLQDEPADKSVEQPANDTEREFRERQRRQSQEREERGWFNGLMFRANKAAGLAKYEDWSAYAADIDDGMITAVGEAADLWAKQRDYLQQLVRERESRRQQSAA